MSKILAIHGGGDWADASVDYVVLPEGMDIEVESKAHRNWYHTEYLPACRRGEKPQYCSLEQWVIKRGARPTTDAEILIFYDAL